MSAVRPGFKEIFERLVLLSGCQGVEGEIREPLVPAANLKPVAAVLWVHATCLMLAVGS